MSMDDTDRKILRALQKDARASFKKIGEDVGVSEATVFVRVRKLRENGVLRGFKAVVDPRAVGKGLTAIMLVRANPKSLTGALDALKRLDDIYEIYDVTGQYYSILKVRTESTETLGRIIDEIGTIEGIAGTETIVVLRTVKEESSVKI